MSMLDHNRYDEFLVKLRQARLDAGFTQVEVAMALDQHHAFISRCETGERRVDFVEVQIFAELYGKDVGYFLTRTRKAPTVRKRKKRR